MNDRSASFITHEATAVEDLGDGIHREILGYQPSLMVARVWFDAGAVGTVHAHPHAQVTYVESGEFEFRVGDEKQILVAGDCACIPPNELHGTTCLKKGALIDVFSPLRADFLTESQP